MKREEIVGLIWVCVCCMLIHANGECCTDDTHGGDSREPLSKITDGYSITAGLLRKEHSEDCPNREESGEDVECDCDKREFSQSQCEGCGSYLHGTRYAATLWRKLRVIEVEMTCEATLYETWHVTVPVGLEGDELREYITDNIGDSAIAEFVSERADDERDREIHVIGGDVEDEPAEAAK